MCKLWGSKTIFRLLALGDFCGILLLEEKIIQELFLSDTDFCQQLNPRLILRFGAILAPKVDVILLVVFFSTFEKANLKHRENDPKLTLTRAVVLGTSNLIIAINGD